MNARNQASAAKGTAESMPWTCPVCPLLCDGFSLSSAGTTLHLSGSKCSRAGAALSMFGTQAAASEPAIDGQAVSLEAALDAAATLLRASRQALFGGMATDVAGTRALFRLANATGAVLDHAKGDSLMHSLRALQDRGLFYTTLAEIRNRADLVVCLGTDPGEHYPEFFNRCAPAADASVRREVVFVGAGARPVRTGLEADRVEALAPAGDVFDVAAMLAALVSGRRPARPDDALAALAERMRSASYCVLVWESGRLPEHGALFAEAVLRIVDALNRTTRAASFCLGGDHGAYTANYALAWMSGLPLRTGVLPRGLVHEPQRYATTRLVADKAVDLLLWVASFGAELAPPVSDLPLVVLGHPALRTAVAVGGRNVFIPVSTPGIGSAGHLFRADGGVVLPLVPVYEDRLPTVAEVATRLCERLGSASGEGGR